MKIVIIVFFLFVFSISIRLWNIGQAGRWTDEQAYLEKSYTLANLFQKGDFSNEYWYVEASDHPPFATYFYGITSFADLIRFDSNAHTIFPSRYKGAPIFTYDLLYSRLLSVFISSLAVIVVFFFGYRFFSLFVGITAAVILATIPHFLGFSQFVGLETWITLFFTSTIFAYIVYLQSHQKRYLLLTGILTGITLDIKQSDVLLFLAILGIFYVMKRKTKKCPISYWHIVSLCIVAVISSIFFYPMPWLHLSEFLRLNYNLWFRDSGLIPELIFGRLMGARFFYYILAVFITTPILILLLTTYGIAQSYMKKKEWIYTALLVWFITPFAMTFFHVRQHMVQYMIQFYAPLSLLAALGLETVAKKIPIKSNANIFAFLIVCSYLIFIDIYISPYYLNYYNELVGGTKTVYEKNLFFLGWFGEGLKQPGMYLQTHAKEHMHIGLALTPQEQTLYKVPNLHYEIYSNKKRYDYVVVNTFHVQRMNFDENKLQKEYRLVYRENAGGADIAHVYKKK